MADNIVVSGTHLRKPELQTASPFTAVTPAQAYGPLLKRLQIAVRANDRRSIIRSVALPLRVSGRSYRDAASVERDFDAIFTPRVKRAILAQRADALFVRDQGAMVGDGEVWMSASCANRACSKQGAVQIIAVNP